MAKKKGNAELKRQIKAMEDQARAEAMSTEEVTVVQPEAKDQPVISFDQWWMVISRKVKMRPHLKEILFADFTSRGLSKKETEQRYDDTLRLFGMKW